MDVPLHQLVDEATADRLASVADGLPRSAAVVLESRSASFAAAVAVAWAHGLAAPVDVREFVPAADRFKVDELDQVVAAAALRPETRNVLVLAAADTLGESGCARLLRTVEEPSAPTVFVLAVSDRSTLSVPMAGRLHAAVAVAGHDAARARTTARELGLDADSATRLVELVAPRFELVPLLGAGSLDPAQLLDALARFSALGCDDGPDAVPGATAALGELTASVATAARGELGRDLCRLQLARWSDGARRKLRARDRDGLELVAAVARASSLLDRYAPPAAALTTVLARGAAAARW